ncbi:MAG: fructose-bisphosphate aldolase class I [Candidatus Pacebacteria bacterium]|nr:fructose-bisphosphate aldolase class I [Candidatus Paceibacterota bacterium]
MNQNVLIDTAKKLVAKPKGILAIDESMATCNKRFEALGIPATPEKRQSYRELLVTAPGIENYISGYILFDETIRQSTLNGKSFVSVLGEKGIEVGIKVDAGLVDLDRHIGEKVTKGLDGLDERLKEYRSMGATFAKWRGVYTIGINVPSEDCMRENAKSFAKYAKLCQENDIVPIVEPEVLFDGDHTIERCYEVTTQNLEIVFTELKNEGVFLPGIVLKTSMVLPGKELQVIIKDEEIAKMTVRCLKEKVPSEIGGIVFLSGGQKDEEAMLRLNEMHKLGDLPWPLTFSYGRAIQNSALQSFAKNPDDVALAQTLLVSAAKNNSLASVGEYK